MITSEYEVACDVFDTKLNVSMHTTKEGQKKLLIKMSDKEGNKISLSLWRQDVQLLSQFIQQMSYNIEEKP